MGRSQRFLLLPLPIWFQLRPTLYPECPEDSLLAGTPTSGFPCCSCLTLLTDPWAAGSPSLSQTLFYPISVSPSQPSLSLAGCLHFSISVVPLSLPSHCWLFIFASPNSGPVLSLCHALPNLGGSLKCPLCSWHPPGPSSVFSVDKIDRQPPIPTWESGPRGPIIPREIFHPPSPRPHPLPQSIGYILSQGMSGSHRHFLRAWGWEGAWEWSLLRSCWSRSLHNFKPHPLFVVMPPAINRGSQSIFFKNKHQTGLTWPEKQPLAGAHPSSVPVSSHPRWLAELERKLGVRRRRGSLQDATWTG